MFYLHGKLRLTAFEIRKLRQIFWVDGFCGENIEEQMPYRGVKDSVLKFGPLFPNKEFKK